MTWLMMNWWFHEISTCTFSKENSLSHTQTNKQQLQQPTKGVTVYCACV